MGTQVITSQQATPQLFVQQISDTYLRNNFQNLAAYFSSQNQLLNFKFFEVNFTSAQTNFTLPHGLPATPQDLIVTRVTGTGSVSFNWNAFTNTNLSISCSGPVRVRFFVGVYWNFQSAVTNASTDVQTFYPIAPGHQTQIYNSQTTTVSSTKAAQTAGQVYTIVSTDDFVAFNCTQSTFSAFLPPASSMTGRTLILQKTDTTFNKVTVTVANGSSDFINSSGITSFNLATLRDTVTLFSNGSNWMIVNRDFDKNWSSLNVQFTPVNLGQVTSAKLNWRRESDSLRVRLNWKNGTPVASTASITLSTGLTIDFTKLAGVAQIVGRATDEITSVTPASSSVSIMFTDGSTSNSIFFATQTASNAYVKGTGSGVFSVSGTMDADFLIPIVGWAG